MSRELGLNEKSAHSIVRVYRQRNSVEPAGNRGRPPKRLSESGIGMIRRIFEKDVTISLEKLAFTLTPKPGMKTRYLRQW